MLARTPGTDRPRTKWGGQSFAGLVASSLNGIAHTVGGFASAAAAEGGPDLWEQMYRLNVLTTLNIFRAALPPMCAAGRGSLLAIGAGAAVKAPSGLGAYAGAKSAVHRLVESFADELKADRIRVNAILPSIIDTPQNRAAMPDADHTAWVRPREIADAIAFLLAEDASGVTGAFIPVSGRV
ncbi:SDR family oxidoreductase [Roseomonas sp. USHLN139]|uniref:SDR family oxidoreductase n=1 Tax=Roseomonas sp. USHLN139 TaxID=3081298 RepID=UPI003B015F9D